LQALSQLPAQFPQFPQSARFPRKTVSLVSVLSDGTAPVSWSFGAAVSLVLDEKTSRLQQPD